MDTLLEMPLFDGELICLGPIGHEKDPEIESRWNCGDAFVGIGLGDRADWNKGYGADAMRLILRYAFLELNLHRVSLGVFEYNPRAMRAYEKAGFREEGRIRGELHHDGRRWDGVFMGVLRPEWMEQYGNQL